MGAAYAALDTRLDRQLALKVMLPEFAADRDAKERFLREARAAAKITHDNVVTVYQADERQGVPYIAMQFLQGFLPARPADHGVRVGVDPGQVIEAAGQFAGPVVEQIHDRGRVLRREPGLDPTVEGRERAVVPQHVERGNGLREPTRVLAGVQPFTEANPSRFPPQHVLGAIGGPFDPRQQQGPFASAELAELAGGLERPSPPLIATASRSTSVAVRTCGPRIASASGT